MNVKPISKQVIYTCLKMSGWDRLILQNKYIRQNIISSQMLSKSFCYPIVALSSVASVLAKTHLKGFTSILERWLSIVAFPLFMRDCNQLPPPERIFACHFKIIYVPLEPCTVGSILQWNTGRSFCAFVEYLKVDGFIFWQKKYIWLMGGVEYIDRKKTDFINFLKPCK